MNMVRPITTTLNSIRLMISKTFSRPSIITEILKDKIIFAKRDNKEISEFLSKYRKVSGGNYHSSNSTVHLNKLANIEDWNILEFQQTLNELFDGKMVPYIWRKHWEWVLGIIAMKRFNLLNKKIIALGVGAGKEDILYYLANNIGCVYATDLYRGDWEEAPTDFPENPNKYAPYNYRQEGLRVLTMDGTKLEFPDEMFDAVFSFSSVEHFDGENHSGSLRSLKEMERVLKKGGLAIVATEYVVNGKQHPEYFNREDLYVDLINKLRMRLVEPLNLTISPTTLDTILDFYSAVLWHNKDIEYKRKNPHIILRRSNVLYTSMMLVFQK